MHAQHKMNLEAIFTYHSPTPEQLPKYQALREAALSFAQAIDAHTPDGPDKSAAIRHVREAVMTANAGIALEGKL